MRLTGCVFALLCTRAWVPAVGDADLDVLFGPAERWCVCAAGGGDVTTTLAGGGEADTEPGPPDPGPTPIDRRCGGRSPVPEVRIRAIAAPPSTSATSGAAAARASTQIGRLLPRSLADNGLLSPSFGGLPRP